MPRLVVAAGHGTHAAALAARRATGGRLVVLMRPTLPLRWFDLCLVPEHDLDSNSAVRTHDRVVTTTGVLNTVRPSTASDSRRGLLLIGGPSKHHGWDAGAIVQQVQDVVIGEPSVHWTLTTSRRTPSPVLDLLVDRRAPNLDVIPFQQTHPGWVASRLAESRTVFVSEDSVSMLYEALSAAADVGLLAVPRNRMSRVIRGVDRLVQQRAVIPFSEWQTNRFEQRQPVVLQEADRCARVVCERLLDAA